MTLDEEKRIRDWLRTFRPPSPHHRLLASILAVQLELIDRVVAVNRNMHRALSDEFFPAAAERELEAAE